MFNSMHLLDGLSEDIVDLARYRSSTTNWLSAIFWFQRCSINWVQTLFGLHIHRRSKKRCTVNTNPQDLHSTSKLSSV